MTKTVILASTSPRRIEMMGWLKISFQPIPSTVDESKIRHKAPRKLTRLLAEAKAQSLASKYPDAIVIGSDAIVSFKDQILEKPRDKQHQRKMINMQKGQEAKVYSSVCIIDTSTGQKVIKSKTTPYKMADISPDEIERYIDTNSGLDKAGGYGQQDENGMFVDSINGCYTNAIGFPMCDVASILKAMNVPVVSGIKQIVKSKTGRKC